MSVHQRVVPSRRQCASIRRRPAAVPHRIRADGARRRRRRAIDAVDHRRARSRAIRADADRVRLDGRITRRRRTSRSIVLSQRAPFGAGPPASRASLELAALARRERLDLLVSFLDRPERRLDRRRAAGRHPGRDRRAQRAAHGAVRATTSSSARRACLVGRWSGSLTRARRAIVTNTRGREGGARRAFCGMPPSAVTVLPNPLDLDRIRALAAEPIDATSRWPAGPVLVHVGRFTYAKDHDTLLRGFALLRGQRPATLVLVGDGEDEARVRALCTELGLDDDVRVHRIHAQSLPLPRARHAVGADVAVRRAAQRADRIDGAGRADRLDGMPVRPDRGARRQRVRRPGAGRRRSRVRARRSRRCSTTRSDGSELIEARPAARGARSSIAGRVGLSDVPSELVRQRSNPAAPPVHDDRRVLLRDAADLFEAGAAVVRVELADRRRRRRSTAISGAALRHVSSARRMWYGELTSSDALPAVIAAGSRCENDDVLVGVRRRASRARIADAGTPLSTASARMISASGNANTKPDEKTSVLRVAGLR